MPMSPDRLLAHFDRISEAPDAVPRLRRFILDLAVGGKLVEQDSAMPEISRFLLGIVTAMYFNDHNPPHFHVRYDEYRALIGIEPLELRKGELPQRVLGLVMEWGEMHQSELMENWTTLANEGNFKRIAPLVLGD